MRLLEGSLNRKVLAVLLGLFAIQIGLFIWYGSLLDQLQSLEQQEARSRIFLGHLNWIEACINASIVGKIGQTSGDNPGYAHLFQNRSDRSRVRNDFEELSQLLKDDPAQTERLHSLQRRCDELWQALDKAGAGQVLKDPAVQQVVQDIPKLRHDILEGERDRTSIASEALPTVRQRIRTFINLAIFLDVIAAVGAISWFNRDIARRIAIVSENSLRLARREPLPETLTGNDEIDRLDQVFHDVADQLTQMWKRERAIVENAVDVICSIDAEGRFTEINRASLSAWGYPPEELLGSRYVNIVASKSREMTMKFLSAAQAKGETVRFENQVLAKDGRILETSWSCLWSKERSSYFCVIHDISERKHIEQLKQQFVAMISHDLRTPLTGLSAFLESIQHGVFGKVDERLVRLSVSAHNNTLRLIAMVNDLLSIEKLESGTQQLDLRDIDLNMVISSSVDVVQDLAHVNKMEIEFNRIELTVHIDPERISQVIINLLGNAIKFSPPGGHINVLSQVKKDYLEISVSDEGRGIKPEDQQLIFERFKQANTEDSKRGTGLGLAICKSIVELHDGTIGVESEVGQGSRFWIRLPLANPAHSEKGRERTVRTERTENASPI